MTTPLLQYVAPFDGGGDIVGFGWECYKESRPWCSLFVELASLFVVPSGEQLTLPMVWRGDKLVHHFPSFPIFFSGQSVVVDVTGVAFRSRAGAVGRGVVTGCTRIFNQEYVHET